MIKLFFNYLYRYICLRDALIQKTEQPVKFLAGCLLLGAAAMFLLNHYRVIALPDFHQITPYDTCLWVISLVAVAMVQLAFAVSGKFSGCLKCRIWGAWWLQVSGVALVAVGGVFIAEYPPYNHLMSFFTIMGFLIACAGLSLNARARQQKRGI